VALPPEKISGSQDDSSGQQNFRHLAETYGALPLKEELMPVCPKCKAEYVEGITYCSDCHIPLIDEDAQKAPHFVHLISAEAPFARRILEFLSYSGLDVHMDFDQEADLFAITLPDAQYNEGLYLAKLVFADEVFKTAEAESQHPQRVMAEPVKTHVLASDRYEDTRASAFAFLSVGTVILTAAWLVFQGTVRLPMSGDAVSLTTALVAGTGTIFFSIGVYSFQKTRFLHDKIQEEQQFNASVYQWFLSTYTTSQIDLTADAEMDQDVAMNPEKRFTIISDEIRCLKRMDVIREYLKRQYLYLDDGYIEYLCEEIYQKMFEDNTAKYK